MAKRFGGFTPDQLGKIVPEMAGMQADEQAKFLAATPGAAARVGAMTERARSKIEGQPKGYALGGLTSVASPLLNAAVTTAANAINNQPKEVSTVPTAAYNPSSLDTARQAEADALASLQAARDAQAANPEDTALTEAADKAQVAVNQAQDASNTALQQYKALNMPSTAEFIGEATNDPTSLITQAPVATATPEQIATGQMAAGTGQLGAATDAQATAAQPAASVTTPTAVAPATVTAQTAAPAVEDTVSKLVAATGKPTAEALAEAASMTPEQLAQLGLSPALLAEAQRVQPVAPRTVQEGELIAGPTVDMGRVETAVNFAAATGAPSTDATVQGQLTSLMSDFEGAEPPAWAAGAMRAATAQLAARGLGASSMAGQAIVQAAMESSLPIAMQDAQTAATFEMQNLSNRQQTAMFAAEQRANFLGMEFTQGFQTRVSNAARISDIANMNFSAEQQVALENARMAQSVDLANLSSRSAKVMADAAAMSQLDLTNLNNRQQTAVQNAQSFLQMDMSNLSNEQQAVVFKSQAVINSMLTDQAAENAALQFNASSENQSTQFFSNLSATVGQFNADQANAMERFNAGEANALAEFNATQSNLRDQFNATNSLVIEQANAQWYQTVATTDNAAINQSNRDAAQAASEMTGLAFNATMQEARDIMSYAFQTADNDATRATNIAIAKYAADSEAAQSAADAKASKSAGLWGAIGSVGAAIVRGW